MAISLAGNGIPADDRIGFLRAESGAITEYVIDAYGEGRLIPPPKTPERLRYTYWLHYAEGTFMPLMILSLVIGVIIWGTGSLPLVWALCAGM